MGQFSVAIAIWMMKKIVNLHNRHFAYAMQSLQFLAARQQHVSMQLHNLKYPPWHRTPAYYAFYYAGIFDTGLTTPGPTAY